MSRCVVPRNQCLYGRNTFKTDHNSKQGGGRTIVSSEEVNDHDHDDTLDGS